MQIVVYGDFNCPFSCLASARVDRIIEQGRADVQWRAVEHDPDISVPSPVLSGEAAAMFDREIAEVLALVQPGEACPIRRPRVRANTAAAIAGFGSALPADADRVRRGLFAAYWAEGADIADPAELAALGVGTTTGADMVVARWREAWVGLGRTIVPMLVLPDGYVSRGLGALQRLAGLATGSHPREAPPPAGRQVTH
jgi:predicted DsbA family dithiol-disulfide isomerase